MPHYELAQINIGRLQAPVTAPEIAAFDDQLMAINMSVWTDAQSLAAFVYRSAHHNIMRQRAAWFEKMELFQCLWWVQAGHRPDPAEGIARLETLRRVGPTVEAFTFRVLFPVPGEPGELPAVLDQCG